MNQKGMRMKKVFISYRRQDSPGYVRALYDRLVQHFSSIQVFMDVDDIQLGSDFVSVLDVNLKGCAVMLVVIGKEWLNVCNNNGERRLDNPADFVRLEISRALQRGIPVIPILVNNAQMPSESDLPDDLKPLARRQALELNNKNYDYSTHDLVKALEKYLGKARKLRSKEELEENSQIQIPWYKKRPLSSMLYTVFGFVVITVLAVFLYNNVSNNIINKADNTEKPTDNGIISTKAGFDCNAAGTVSEKAICASNATRQADKAMSDAYRAFEAKIPPAERDAIWELQKIWLLSRDNHIQQICLAKPTQEQTSSCITDFYQEHTATLKTYLSSRFTAMRIFDPPSNIREKPNGSIRCAAPVKHEKITIYIIPMTDKEGDAWYWTEYCGKNKWGVIHNSQIKPL